MIVGPNSSIISFDYYMDSQSGDYNFIPFKSIGDSHLSKEIQNRKSVIGFFKAYEYPMGLSADAQVFIDNKSELLFINLDGSDCGLVWSHNTSVVNIYKMHRSAKIVLITVDVDIAYEMNFLELLKNGVYDQLIQKVVA